MSKRFGKIAVCATEDWFVLSHFVPLLRALRACADDVVVITRSSGRTAEIESHGVRVVPFNYQRQSTHPVRVSLTAWQLAKLLRREKPDAVHLISLKPIVLGAAAITVARTPTVGIHVTGLGLIAASTTRSTMLSIARTIVQRLYGRPGSHVFVENEDDLKLLLDNRADARERITVLGGAGVDPAHFVSLPYPAGPPRLAYVGRLIASKGIDVAIEAIRRLRAANHDTQLHLYGKIDSDNPEAIAEETIRAWERDGLATWHGPIADVRQVWRDAAIAVVPSLGGEGLPRSLLEAAACGRAIVVTDVPGCRRFVRDGVEGFVVPPGSAQALADAIEKLLLSRETCAAMGARASQRVLDGFTEVAVEREIVAAYAEMAARRS
jgi:glycosyltransferase involved in cell wall biosynthesis